MGVLPVSDGCCSPRTGRGKDGRLPESVVATVPRFPAGLAAQEQQQVLAAPAELLLEPHCPFCGKEKKNAVI